MIFKMVKSVNNYLGKYFEFSMKDDYSMIFLFSEIHYIIILLTLAIFVTISCLFFRLS